MTSLIATIIFLFTLFVTSKEDFVFLRKNISLKIIFDIAIIVGIVALLFSRVVYAISHPSLSYLNPLVFFIIPYFPGLSAVGLVLGGLTALYIITVRQKLPVGKLYDVFSLSFLLASAFFFLTDGFFQLFAKHLFVAISDGIAFLLLSVCFFLIKRFSVSFSWKDGSSALWSLVVVLSVWFVVQTNIFTHLPLEFPYFLVLFFLLFLSFLIKTFKRAGQRL